MKELHSTHLPALARGLAFYGSGGGGEVRYPALLAAEQLECFGPVRLRQLQEVPDDALVVPLAFLGVPSVGAEKLEGCASLRALVAEVRQRRPGRPLMLSVAELGGGNGLSALLVAGQLGLDVVDADLVGRAFPELQMAATTLLGPNVGDVVFASDRGEVHWLESASAAEAEARGRALAVAYGGSAAVAPRLLDGAQARHVLLPGGLARALAVGRALGAATPDAAAAAAAAACGGRVLLRACVAFVAREVAGGFVGGTLGLEGACGTARLSVRNEFLALDVRGVRRACSPDVLSLVDVERGEIFSSEAVDVGAEVDVVAAPAPPLWYTAAGLALVGPAALQLPDPAASCTSLRGDAEERHDVG